MSNNGCLKVVPSVFAALIHDGKVLLLRRANTGYADGWWDLPAGHLEDREELAAGAARELAEETGIKADAKDLKLIHVHQNHNNEPPHYGFIFKVEKWLGEHQIMEPDKCDRMEWVSLDKLPKKLLPYSKAAIQNLTGSTSISYHGPDSIEFEED